MIEEEKEGMELPGVMNKPIAREGGGKKKGRGSKKLSKGGEGGALTASAEKLQMEAMARLSQGKPSIVTGVTTRSQAKKQ